MSTGYDKGKISIIREGDTILIEADTSNNREYIIKNSLYPKKLVRKYILPKGLNEDKTEAEYTDGILRIRMPKSTNTMSKRISLK
jgi:HSP20 family molecular chaperone IbpA